MLDLGEAVVDQVTGVRVLPELAVHPRAQLERVRVADFLRRHQPRAHRTVRVERLPHRHGGRPELPVAHADVVHHEIAGDHLVRPVAGHVAAAPTDHERELALVVEQRRDARQVNRVERAGDARRLLVEEHRDGGRLEPRLLHVVGVVETDGEELRRTEDRRAQPDVNEREASARGALRVPRRCHRGATRGEERHHVAREARGHGREVDDLLANDHADPGGAVVGERGELHATSSIRSAACRGASPPPGAAAAR